MNHSGIFGQEGIDLAQVQPDAVRYGVVVRLPFRLRVAGLVRVPLVDAASDVWLFNGVAIPPGSHLPAILHDVPGKERDGYAALWTEAIVVLNMPTLVEGALNALRQGETGSLGLGGNLFRALTSLNEVIFGYAEAASTIFGGNSLRFLTDTEFFAGLRLDFALITAPGHPVGETDIREVIEWRPQRDFRRLGQLTGDLTDLPVDALSSIPRHIERLRAHAYHELAFRAKMAMLGREPLVALVLACAALEGAHADLLRRFLGESLTAYGSRANGLIDDLLREQGIYTLLQLTSQAFMGTSRRPDVGDIQQCLEALTMRNDIVHAKQKKGSYKLRTHTFKDLSDAYQAVFKIYSAFVDALEPRDQNGD
jgi:hypothetical protein